MTYFGFIFATLLFRIDSMICREKNKKIEFMIIAILPKNITGGHIHIFSKICTINQGNKK